MSKYGPNETNRNIDGIGDGSRDQAELAPSWISYYYGKLMILGVVLVIVAFITYMNIDNN